MVDKAPGIGALIPPGREARFRDGFAPDCLLQQGVTCEPDLTLAAAGRRPFPEIERRLALGGHHAGSPFRLPVFLLRVLPFGFRRFLTTAEALEDFRHRFEGRSDCAEPLGGSNSPLAQTRIEISVPS
jgi:hypothetical protein